MSKSDQDSTIKNIFSTVSPYIDFLSTLFSFGLCHIWRRKLIALSGIKKRDTVLDVCTGTGELALLISEKVGANGSVIGLDFCERMLEIAKKKANPTSGNISFVVRDVKNLIFPDNTFNVVTVAFGMRNIPDLISALKEIKRVLKPDGKFVCLELSTPESSWFLPIYRCYVFNIIPFIGKMITKSPVPYRYLPKSIDEFYPQEEFGRMIETCGFSEIDIHFMTMGIATIYLAKKGQ